jgi:small-conductance mechanosensitive channel
MGPGARGERGERPGRRWAPGLAALALAAAGFPAAAWAQQALLRAAGPPAPAAEKARPDDAARPAEKPPAAIELTATIRASEEARQALRRIEERIEDDAVLEETGARLAGTAELLERLGPSADSRRASDLSERDLLELTELLARHEQPLARWEGRLEESARTLHASSKELQRMEATWRLTEEAARAERAPSSLLESIATLRERIRALDGRCRDRLEETLRAQGRVASLRIRIGEWTALAERTEKAREEQLFEIESVPLWKLLARPESGAKLAAQLARSFQVHARGLLAFAAEERATLIVLAAVFAALAWALRRVGRRFRSHAAEDPALRAPAEVLAHPVASALMLTLGMVPAVLGAVPVTVTEILVLAMLLAFARAMGGIIAPGLRTAVYAFGATFAVERLGSLTPEYSLLGRLILLAVASTACAGILHTLRGQAWAAGIASEAWRRALRVAGLAAAALLAVSIAANLVGNVSLARLCGSSTLAVLAVGALLGGVALVLEALFVGLLRLPRARRIGVVARHGALLEVRGATYIRWAAIAAWVLATASAFRLGPLLSERVGEVLTKRLRVGGLDVSLGDVVAFGVTMWVAVLLARFLAFALEEGLEGRGLPRGIPAAISRTAQYVVVAVGFGFAALASGMELTRFTVLVGTLGVGIGFGLQNVVNNFVSGLILLYERPVQVGDIVEIGTTVGTVQRIGIRSSTIATFQGAEVVVPNGNLISGELVNWTLSDRKRRIDVDVGVAYGSDPERVRELLLGTLRGRDDVVASPEPVALFSGFGDSALQFQLRFWTHRFDSWPAVASDVRLSLSRALAEAGIGIPFPQRDLHLRSIAPEAARTLGAGDRDRG